MLTTVEVAQMEVHSAGSTIVGVEVEAAAEHVVVAAAVAVSESVFASIPQAKQAEEEIVIATTGPVDSGPTYSEGKAVVVAAVVVAVAAASEAVVGPIHSDSHFD